MSKEEFKLITIDSFLNLYRELMLESLYRRVIINFQGNYDRRTSKTDMNIQN